MSNSYLQNQIKGPRQSKKDVRVAKTHRSHPERDGNITYNLDAKEDQDKYQTLSEEGLIQEKMEFQDMKASLKSGGGSRKSSDGMAKTVRVGTGNRQTQKDLRKWEAELAPHTGAEAKTHDLFKRGSPGRKGGNRSSMSPDAKERGSISNIKITTKTPEGPPTPDSKAYKDNLTELGAKLGLDAKSDDNDNDNRAEAKASSYSPSKYRTHTVKRAMSAEPSTRSQHRKNPSMMSKADAVTLHEQRIQEAIANEQAYIQEQAERFARASHHGKEFRSMLERATECHERNIQKAAMKKAKEEEEARAQKEERERKKKAHLNKNLDPAGQLSWKEMEEAQEQARRESVEKRKTELLATSKAPAAALKSKKDNTKVDREMYPHYVFRAEDPEKVTAKLNRATEIWNAKLRAIKERAKEKEAEKLLATAGVSTRESPADAMNRRAENVAKRRTERLERQRIAQEKEKQKQFQKEKEKKEALLNMKIPEAGRRLTKSAQNRAMLVRQSFEQEKEEAAAEARAQKRREEKEKEMSRQLKSIITDRERERREMVPDYHELSDTELKSNTLAAAKHYRETLKKNQERIKEVISNRPSLLERHEQVGALKFFHLSSFY